MIIDRYLVAATGLLVLLVLPVVIGTGVDWKNVIALAELSHCPIVLALKSKESRYIIFYRNGEIGLSC
jgi:hypothetical protein